ncbi:uncharacterized protein LOC135394872 [Ornithodoros turicata]|uniref:uncharacterized protein LOC135394872 n=1 Tax=Ornithodoros turicata TaxID=34597 RepID=UPI00313954DC
MLGIRSATRSDFPLSPADLVFGAPLRLPGQFFDPACLQQPAPDPLNFAIRLQAYCTDLRPPPTRPSSLQVFVHPQLATATHVFLRHDATRNPPQPPYDGPFLVHSRQGKTLTIHLPNRLEVVSVDRVKPAFLLPDDPSDPPSPHSHCLSAPPPRSPARRVSWASGPPSVRTVPRRPLVQRGGGGLVAASADDEEARAPAHALHPEFIPSAATGH